MKNMRYGFLFIPSLIILALVGCTQYPVLMEPDTERFDQTIYSNTLRDSLLIGKLIPGMPYYVVDQLFSNYSEGMKEVRVPVATPGSKQRLEEEAAAKKKEAAAGPSLEEIAPDEMLEHIEAIREIMEFSDQEKEIRVMCEQSSIPKCLVDIAVSEPDRLDVLEKEAEG